MVFGGVKNDDSKISVLGVSCNWIGLVRIGLASVQWWFPSTFARCDGLQMVLGRTRWWVGLGYTRDVYVGWLLRCTAYSTSILEEKQQQFNLVFILAFASSVCSARLTLFVM